MKSAVNYLLFLHLLGKSEPQKKSYITLTLGTLAHFSHFKLGSGYAAP
jgi:hypothetical protein